MNETPLDYQIRNSNVESLAVQVKRAGGCPTILPIARDLYQATRELTEHGLRFDMLLLSGGVSAGKYDIVERVLADLGAEFYFDRVLIMPGQPLVFGKAREKFFFGLPGNPASTMVTFEIFARSAVELLGGQKEASLAAGLEQVVAGFSPKNRADALPARDLEPGRGRSYSLAVAGLGRCAVAGARQCISGNGIRPRELGGRGLDSGAAEIAHDHQKEAQPLR